MRITRTIAEEIAKTLTGGKRKEIENLQSELEILATEIKKKYIPKDVLDFYQATSNKSFIKTESHLNLSGNGFNYDRVNTNETLPTLSSVNPSNEEADKIKKLRDPINKKKKELNNLQTEIENTIVALRTYDNIKKQFPEAGALLPASNQPTAVIVNVQSIREKLK